MIDKNISCFGCGVCSAICPRHCISMEQSIEGGYRPVIHQINRCISCGLCEQVCPYVWEKKHYHAKECIKKPRYGVVDRGLVGFVRDERQLWQCASGGLTTRLLQIMLEKRIVDAVICIGQVQSPDRRFSFVKVNTAPKLLECAKSVYYPVEISEMLKSIILSPEKVVIVGLPCLLRGIRNAMNVNKALRQKIQYLFGLTCGQMKSKYYTEFLLDLADVNKEDVIINYRYKSPDHAAGDFAFEAKTEQKCQRFFFWEKISDIWMSDMFKLSSCFDCSDLYAEAADIVFMDAWLPEYSQIPHGHSFVLSRSRFLTDLLLLDGQSSVKEISVDAILRSQLLQYEQKQLCQSECLNLRKKSWNLFDRYNAMNDEIIRALKKSIAQKSNMLYHDGNNANLIQREVSEEINDLGIANAKKMMIVKWCKLSHHPLKTTMSVIKYQCSRLFRK